MDTLPSSVPSMEVSALHSTPREFHLFKTPISSHHQFPPYHHHHLSSSTTKPNTIPSKTAASFTNNSLINSPLFFSSSSSKLFTTRSSPSRTHQNPVSGYAVALLDIAQCNSSVEAVNKDVQRLLKLLQHEKIQAFLIDPFVGVREKGELMKEVAKRGNFDKHLVGLVKMLIVKNKVEMVKQVLVEFERICDEMNGTRLVLVSSAKKMEEDELFGIAKRVQKLSGALKVKVRNLFGERLPSFAI